MSHTLGLCVLLGAPANRGTALEPQGFTMHFTSVLDGPPAGVGSDRGSICPLPTPRLQAWSSQIGAGLGVNLLENGGPISDTDLLKIIEEELSRWY